VLIVNCCNTLWFGCATPPPLPQKAVLLSFLQHQQWLLRRLDGGADRGGDHGTPHPWRLWWGVALRPSGRTEGGTTGKEDGAAARGLRCGGSGHVSRYTEQQIEEYHRELQRQSKECFGKKKNCTSLQSVGDGGLKLPGWNPVDLYINSANYWWQSSRFVYQFST